MIPYLKNILSAENDQDPSFAKLVRVVLIVSTFATTVIAIVLALTLKSATLWTSVVIMTTLAILSGISLFLSYRGILWPGKVALPLALLMGITWFAIDGNGLHDSSIAGFTFVIIMTSLLIGQRAIPFATILTLLGIGMVTYADMSGINNSLLASRTGWDDVTVISMIQIISAASLNGLMARLNAVIKTSQANEQDQIKVNRELRELQSSLEMRVADRTRNLVLAAEVGRAVSQVRDLDAMLKDACELILKEFKLYYVQVYLTDPAQTVLTLEAGTGQVGAQLLRRGHSLPFNTGSINGRAAAEKRAVVISDTAQSATFHPNPLLPETRGEMAVPLIVADKVVGVLDMQSTEPGVLSQDILPAFEALAGQLAVAIQNANLLALAEQARLQVEAQARRLIRAGWMDELDAIHKPEQLGFVFENHQVLPLADASQPDKENIIAVPLAVTGESIGSLVVEIDNEIRREQTNELVDVVARQVAQQIENLRLLESAERYRYEADKAARLQTLEGWQKYIEARPTDSLAYLYDTNEVRPQANGWDEAVATLTTPLKARQEMIGKVLVQDLAQEDEESVDLVRAIAERLSAHIENLRLFEETRLSQLELDTRARQLAAVAEISTASAQELEVDKLLKTVVHLTQRQFDLYHAHIFVYDEVTRELQIRACSWNEGNEHEGTHETSSITWDKEQSLVARAARTGRAVIVNDVKSEPGWLPNPLLPDTASEMAVPLVIGDRVLGVLDVQSDRLHAFTEEDANIQTTLASQVATAMQNARSFEQAQRQAERESMLNTISQKIQSATTVEAVLQIAARELGRALNAPLTVAQLGLKSNGNNGSAN